MRWQRRAGVFLLSMALSGIPWGSVEAAFVGERAPEFALLTIDGQRATLGDYTGKRPLLLVFWATWCPVCKEEIPKLKALYATFTPRGLGFLAINVGINDSQEKATEYRERHTLPYPVAFDEGSHVTRAYRVVGTPTMIIVDRHGTIRYRGSAVPHDLDRHFSRLWE
jgi:peroxiredoxin